MRRFISFALCAAMLCAFLCGCGNQSQERDDMVIGTPAVPEMTPVVTPMPTPDPKNGYVDDKDGIIDEHETEKDPASNGEKNGGKATVSPSPTVTSKP